MMKCKYDFKDLEIFYVTLIAYLPFFVIPSVFDISEFVGSTTSTTPFQSGVKSDDLQFGHTLRVVTCLHLRHAISRAILTCLYFFFLCWLIFTTAGFLNFFFNPIICTKEWLSACNSNLSHCSCFS